MRWRRRRGWPSWAWTERGRGVLGLGRYDWAVAVDGEDEVEGAFQRDFCSGAMALQHAFPATI